MNYLCLNMKKPKLTIELIPKSCWFSNIRTTVSKKDWDTIRYLSYENANGKCEICGEKGKDQGFKHDLECHEIWDFNDDTKVQKLIGLIALCPICHLVKHIGRAKAIGKAEITHNKLMEVNNWTNKKTIKYIEEAFLEYVKRSEFEWTLDLSLLQEKPYDIAINPTKKRKFKVKKYKKKRKKSSKSKLFMRKPKK